MERRSSLKSSGHSRQQHHRGAAGQEMVRFDALGSDSSDDDDDVSTSSGADENDDISHTSDYTDSMIDSSVLETSSRISGDSSSIGSEEFDSLVQELQQDQKRGKDVAGASTDATTDDDDDDDEGPGGGGGGGRGDGEDDYDQSYEDDDDDGGDDDDEEEGTNETSASSDGSDDTKDANVKKDLKKIARKETKSVQLWRRVVVVLLLVAGALISTATFAVLRHEQSEEVAANFNVLANTVSEVCQIRLAQIVGSVRGLAETITAHAIVSQSTFPFVTLPLFEVQGSHARDRSGLASVTYAPIVSAVHLEEWARYCSSHVDWLAESRKLVFDNAGGAGGGAGVDSSSANKNNKNNNNKTGSWHPKKADYDDGTIVPWVHEGFFEPTLGPNDSAPVWQMSPPPLDSTIINFNQLSLGHPTSTTIADLFRTIRQTRDTVLSPVRNVTRLDGTFHDALSGLPHSLLMQPVFQDMDFSSSGKIGGFVTAVLSWTGYLEDILPAGTRGIVCVLRNTCGQAYTYELNGNRAVFLGGGDLHHHRYNSMEKVIPLIDAHLPGASSAGGGGEEKARQGHCTYSLSVYPSKTFVRDHTSMVPLVFACGVAIIFIVMAVAFFMYDWFVSKRNEKVLGAAAKASAIVSSLFPSTVRDRLFGEDAGRNQGGNDDDHSTSRSGHSEMFKSKPIADLFPETTVMFADIAGFTAWSSVREPAQVFMLLETLYRTFDNLARRSNVFKVETVGDCYVAVCGLPNPCKDHAVVMCKFARDCMENMQLLAKKLEVTLGPDTGDLNMRIGLHSGPVTAGVLRGERSRFQLFGDSMNTASRMESTAIKGRIQLSQDTADLLVAAGKASWIRAREDTVVAKGKGEMNTYWLVASEHAEGQSRIDQANIKHMSDRWTKTANEEDARKALLLSSGKTARLIGWVVETLAVLLKQIVARRKVSSARVWRGRGLEENDYPEDYTVIDEVKELIRLPKFDAAAAKKQVHHSTIQLEPAIMEELHDYVTSIAAMYHNNAFHNFEHASHVTMSVVKLLSRIVAPAGIISDDNNDEANHNLHDHTYGITSDPLTQFACVFSALIHDVDHPGVGNPTLVAEKAQVAIVYKGRSVAEQNSVDLALGMLKHDSYGKLRAILHPSELEAAHFRQLVVNCVMATDIMDKELKAVRNRKWDKAFSESTGDEDPQDAVNRKATIVIEHLIQASDVAHTMQHWHVYRKWNERLFKEMTVAFKTGRTEKDPAEFWYQGEIGFFDFYIIPLAKKLKDCGVFGVSSDEYLNYALRNRQEWEVRGKEILCEMKESLVQEGAKEQKRTRELDMMRALTLKASMERRPSMR